MNNENQHIDPVGLLPKYLSGEATPDELKVVSDWLSEKEENRKEFESLRILWNITAPAKKEDIDLDTEWLRMENAITPVQKLTPNLRYILRIAALVILVSVLAYFGIRQTSVSNLKSHSNQLANFNLPDGSNITLNADSRISYKKGFGISHRDLELKGEGYFEVSKSDIPFIIDAGKASIRVTGTKFNLNAYRNKEEIRITVTEGSVQFYSKHKPGSKAVLSEGETGIYNSADQTVISDSTIDRNDFAWRTGIMEFNNTPLKQVINVLENTYHFPVTVDPAVQNCTITVKFENQDEDSILEVLRSTLDLTITRKGKKVLITGEGCF